ncbi:MAG TPA: 4-alpha-glucanotransferase [Vicinamibacteria bacterium]|nr:4-alpha-glucanotransferase [Vicinamibacteria bacterium]
MNGGGALDRLAALYDIETSYEDVRRERKRASEDAIVKMLEHLGAPVRSKVDVLEALARRELDIWSERIDPVQVVAENAQPVLKLRVDESDSRERFAARIELENDGEFSTEGIVADLPPIAGKDLSGKRFTQRELRFDRPLPHGYHRALVEIGDRPSETVLLCPQSKAWAPTRRAAWGVFAPVYALHSERSLGAGDLRDLEMLIDWAGASGASLVGTLPLLPSFLDRPFEPSPYAPVSRLFWSEFYLDIERLPDLAVCEPARKLLQSSTFSSTAKELRSARLVDYRQQMSLKRRVLEELVKSFFTETRPDRQEFEEFVASDARLRNYAEFRAVGELRGQPWTAWPERLREGSLERTDYQESDVRYHLYVQWRSSQQMIRLGEKARTLGLGLYLDLPLGVHDEGYDVWRERRAFLRGCALGAPPDAVFTQGQDWGITPLHPVGLRRDGYRYLVDCLRHHMSCSGVLRVDHVMGLHRVYCIPAGMPATDGVFLRYRPEEIYAIVALESVRNQTVVVGEDLGTVPIEVRDCMKRTGLYRMHVLQYELEGEPKDPFANVPEEVVASVNTHDMPPFAAWWKGSELEERIERRLASPSERGLLLAARQSARTLLIERLVASGRLAPDRTDPFDILAALLEAYASSPAAIVLVTLEDLWLEEQPQNVPGTAQERPNWRRKMRYRIEALPTLPDVGALLHRIDRERRKVS